jgi:hypothetical protein
MQEYQVNEVLVFLVSFMEPTVQFFQHTNLQIKDPYSDHD